MKRSLLLVTLLLCVGTVSAQIDTTIHIGPRWFKLTWDSTFVSAYTFGVDVIVRGKNISGSDTLVIARNNDTTRTRRLQIYPSEAYEIPLGWQGVKYVKVRALKDSVLGDILIHRAR